MKTLKQIARNVLGRFMLVLAALLAVGLFTGVASAQTDITDTLTALNGYWTTAEGIAIAVVLFVVGRRIVKKI